MIRLSSCRRPCLSSMDETKLTCSSNVVSGRRAVGGAEEEGPRQRHVCIPFNVPLVSGGRLVARSISKSAR